MTAPAAGGLAVGQRVRVLDLPVRGHCRTPRYLRGHVGVIAYAVGRYPNPERLAYGGDGLPPVPLYRVRFAQAELWPGYDGDPHDTIEVEVYQHWLAAE